ncbi:CAP domain-containing protein [Ectothiorhodospiraceae bacterium WFHF3C12]|nr:CAP domain-containing protein [Ectothiorhodospiraceae bacterium WFHF3C12]
MTGAGRHAGWWWPVMLAVFAALVSGCAGRAGETAPAASVQLSAPEVTAGFARRLSAARDEARACGGERFAAAGPVAWNEGLADAARRQSVFLASTGRLSHTGRGGSTLEARIRAAGYQPRAWAENVASGQRSAGAAIEAWLDSPGHCRNIMNPAYTEVGVAAARGADDRLYWTLVLAAPMN